jgi:hypothetical protein
MVETFFGANWSFLVIQNAQLKALSKTDDVIRFQLPFSSERHEEYLGNVNLSSNLCQNYNCPFDITLNCYDIIIKISILMPIWELL